MLIYISILFSDIPLDVISAKHNYHSWISIIFYTFSHIYNSLEMKGSHTW